MAAAEMEGLSDEGPMLYDPSLPPGWIRKVTQRRYGRSAGKYDVYLYNPDGRKFRSRSQLADFFVSEGITNMTAGNFDFSVRGIHTAITPASKNMTKKTAIKPNRAKETVSPVATTLAQKLVIKMSFPSVRTSQKGSDDEDVEETETEGKRNRAAAVKGKKNKGSKKKKQDDKETEKVPLKRGRKPKQKTDATDARDGLPVNTPKKRGRKRKTPLQLEVEDVPMKETSLESKAKKGRKGEAAQGVDVSAVETPVKLPAKRGRKPKVAIEKAVVMGVVDKAASDTVDSVAVQQGAGTEAVPSTDTEVSEKTTDVLAAVSQPVRRRRGRPRKVAVPDPIITEMPDACIVSEGIVVPEKKSDEQEMAVESIPIPNESVASPKRRGRKPATERANQQDLISVEAPVVTLAKPRRRGRKRASESETMETNSDTTSVSVATPKRRGRKPSVTSETATVEVHAIPRDVTIDESNIMDMAEGQKPEVVTSESENSCVQSTLKDSSTIAVDIPDIKPSHRGRKCAVEIVNSLPVIEPAPIELGPRVRRKSWRLSDSLYDSGETKPRSTHRKNYSNRNKTTAAKNVTLVSDDNTTTAEASELYTMLKLPNSGGGNSTSTQMDVITEKLAMSPEKSVLVKASDLHELSNIEHIPKLPPSNILSDFSSNWEFLDNSDVPPAIASTSQMDLGPRDDVECYSTDLMSASEHGEPKADISLDIKSPVQLDHSYYCINPRMQKVGKSKSPPLACAPIEKLPKLTIGGSPAGKRTKISSERKIVRSPKGIDDTTEGGDFVKSIPATTSDFFMSSSGDTTAQPQQANVATTASSSDQKKVADIGTGSSLSRTAVDAGAYILYA